MGGPLFRTGGLFVVDLSHEMQKRLHCLRWHPCFRWTTVRPPPCWTSMKRPLQASPVKLLLGERQTTVAPERPGTLAQMLVCVSGVGEEALPQQQPQLCNIIRWGVNTAPPLIPALRQTWGTKRVEQTDSQLEAAHPNNGVGVCVYPA